MSGGRERQVAGRLRQAAETLGEANILAESRQWRGVINRAYYATFYAGLALLAMKEIKTSKHSGAIGMFDLHFVKTGIFPADLAKGFRHAFHARDDFDYRDLESPSESQGLEVLDSARRFVSEAERIIEAYAASKRDES